MKIIKFGLFENSSKQTLGNTSGMGNVKAPQPMNIPEKVIETKPPIVDENIEEETDVNENICTFDTFNEVDLEKLVIESRNFDGVILNENKQLENIALELSHQRKSIDKLNNNITILDKRLSTMESGMVKIIKLNNLKTK